MQRCSAKNRAKSLRAQPLGLSAQCVTEPSWQKEWLLQLLQRTKCTCQKCQHRGRVWYLSGWTEHQFKHLKTAVCNKQHFAKSQSIITKPATKQTQEADENIIVKLTRRRRRMTMNCCDGRKSVTRSGCPHLLLLQRRTSNETLPSPQLLYSPP